MPTHIFIVYSFERKTRITIHKENNLIIQTAIVIHIVRITYVRSNDFAANVVVTMFTLYNHSPNYVEQLKVL